MAQVSISIAGFSYTLACRDGEEPHLTALGEKLDGKVQEAIKAVGNAGEVRQLLLGALLLADELHEAKLGNTAATPPPSPPVAPVIDLSGLAKIAERIENLAVALEKDQA